MKPPQTISITQPRVTNQDTDKVYSDKKCNELRDDVVALRKQRDTLAEALGYLMQSCESIDCEAMMPAAMPFAYIKAKQALAAVKGGYTE